MEIMHKELHLFLNKGAFIYAFPIWLLLFPFLALLLWQEIPYNIEEKW